MRNLAGWLARRFLSISPDQATAARRGFEIADPSMRDRLERIGTTFIRGYHSAFEATSIQRLGVTLDSTEQQWRGFAYEGAAMALALLDCLTLGSQDRLGAFLRGPGDAHKYMVHVGSGWALARIPMRIGFSARALDPLLKWLAVDGLGFHEGYFHWFRYSDGGRPGKRPPGKRPNGYGARAFDQGLGRSLWFVHGGQVDLISATINRFAEPRRKDLWSGIGLACAYAGAISRVDLEQLKAAAGCCRPSAAQGAAFAAKARQQAGNPAPHTALACQVLCGMPAGAAAAVTDAALHDLEAASEVPRYEAWRSRISAILGEQESMNI